MNQRLASWTMGLLLSGLSVQACAEIPDRPEDARFWLERMSVAMNQMSYQGTFVYLIGGQVETLRITHVVDETGSRERLYSVTGPHREVVRDAKGIRCVMSDQQAVMEDALVNRSFFPDLPMDIFDQENRPYIFEVAGAERIARRVGRRIAIMPKDEYRYGYEFFLEQDSGLLLKWVVTDINRKPLAQVVFTELRLGAEVDSSELEPQSLPAEFVHVESLLPKPPRRMNDSPHWRMLPVPPGFELTTVAQRDDKKGRHFEHLVYSDGLAAVSVYIEPDDGTSGVGVSRIGTAHAYVRNAGPMRVTTIGEVPEVTVKAIGDAVAKTPLAP